MRSAVHEHQVQRVEHGAFHVPVEAVRLQVQAVGVRQQARQPVRNLLPVARGNADVDRQSAVAAVARDLALRHVASVDVDSMLGERRSPGQVVNC
jgi:hypothetical protein